MNKLELPQTSPGQVENTATALDPSILAARTQDDPHPLSSFKAAIRQQTKHASRQAAREAAENVKLQALAG